MAGEQLKVDIPGLLRGAADVGLQGAALTASHRASVASLSDAEPGWVGSSADALVQLAGKLQAVSANQQQAIEKQSTQMDTAGRIFTYMEERNSAELDVVADGVRAADM